MIDVVWGNFIDLKGMQEEDARNGDVGGKASGTVTVQ